MPQISKEDTQRIETARRVSTAGPTSSKRRGLLPWTPSQAFTILRHTAPMMSMRCRAYYSILYKYALSPFFCRIVSILSPFSHCVCECCPSILSITINLNLRVPSSIQIPEWALSQTSVICSSLTEGPHTCVHNAVLVTLVCLTKNISWSFQQRVYPPPE